jgi:phytoene dehydrogenase-like protein
VCAAYLARAGLDVVVLDPGERLAGAGAWPGLRDARGLLHAVVARELGLRADAGPRDPSVFAPLDGGGGILVWRDPNRRAASIAEVSRADAEAYGRFDDEFAEAALRLGPLLAYPATHRHVRRALKASERRDLFARTVEGSIADLCDEYFSCDAVQGLVASHGVLGSAAGPRTPGTAAVYLQHSLADGRCSILSHWHAAGVAGALAADVRAHGGAIRLDARVAGVIQDGARRATGVVLADGERLDASTVTSSLDPKVTLGLLDPSAKAPEFTEDIELLPSEAATIIVNFVLGAPPRWAGMSSPGELGPEHEASVHIAPSVDDLERSCRTAAEGAVPSELWCRATLATRAADSAAGPTYVLSVVAQYVPYRLAGGGWDERRDEAGEVVIAMLERYAPGFEALVTEREVLAPTDVEARFGVSGGHPYCGEILPDWLFDRRPSRAWHRHRTPLPGLYLCGPGTHPGPAVPGASGRSAARALIEDRVAATAG